MNDYIITTDACGRHYISHGYEWKSHKYILRIGKGAKALYFYTQKEIQNYLNKNQKTDNASSIFSERSTAQVNNQRFVSRKRNVTGVAEPITVSKKEKVSSGNKPVSGANMYTNRLKTNATRRAKEYEEAVKAVNNYQFKKFETKRAVKGLVTADNLRDAEASAIASGRAIKRQVKYGGKALKEIADFAGISLKSYSEDKKRDLTKQLNRVLEKTKTSIVDDARKIYRKPDGTFVVVSKKPNTTYVEPANNKNATLLGDSEARKEYQRAKDDVRYLKNTLNKLKKEDQELTSVAHNVDITEAALERANRQLVKAKEAYDRTRTIDEIPDYIYTKGVDLINKIFKKRG